MAVRFEFYLSDNYFDRMAILKEKMGKDDLNFNEFAKELLENELYRQQPKIPVCEEQNQIFPNCKLQPCDTRLFFFN